MTSLSIAIEPEPVGIIIQSGKRERKPAVFWAYVWAADDEAASDHWHLHVPAERAA